MASITTNKGRYLLTVGATGAVDLLADTIEIILLGTGYTPNKDHDFVSDVVANELSGTGYTGGFGGSGRRVLASKTLTEDDTNDISKFDAADVTWAGISAGTIAYAAIAKRGTTNADSPLLGIVDVADLVTNGGDVTIQWHANGILNWS